MGKINNPKLPGHTVPQTRTGAASPNKPAPLFRSTDWLTFALTTALVWVGYFLTLAPDLTLEDSGELATASFYAGIPHPPGYPVWTIYTWFWTLIPYGNVAWRVGLGCATAGALACGLLALLVSRGSSMLMEGLEDLKNMRGKWENAICMAAGFVSGMLLGFNGYMWSQSVIVEVYSFSVLSLMGVLTCLLRWIYAPHQRRYLYLAMFIFGICFTTHQTLVVAAMGIEVAIAAAHPRLGRNLFLGNSILYGMGLIAKGQGLLRTFESPPDQINMIFFIFNMVGVASIAAYIWVAILTKEDLPELARDACLAAAGLLFLASYSGGGPVRFLGFNALVCWIILTWKTRKLGLEQLSVMLMGFLWIAGAAFYLYMPISGMTTPPMQWGYPRTVEGFFHALTRGQYEKTNPTNFLTDPERFIMQLGMLVKGVGDEFSWVYTLIALVPFLYFLKMHRRERAWLVGIVAIYLCLGVLLMILLNPTPERASRELVRVFFTASHVLVALLVGYGLTIVAAYMATHYQQFRTLGLIGGGVAVALAAYELLADTEEVYFGGATTGLAEIIKQIGKAFAKDQYGLPVFANLLLIVMTVTFVIALLVYRSRAPLAITLGLFALMPSNSIMTHWADNEQRGHLFGYWFGHDMFTPPFVGPDGKLTYDPVLREQAIKGPNGHLVYPEMPKHTVLYGGTDPGRFCPTYMIFCESFIPARCKPRDPNFDRRDVYLITQNALADQTYLCYLRSQYNRSKQIDPPFFQELLRSKKEKAENYYTNILARMVIPLDRFFAKVGEKVEKRRRTFTSWFKPEHFTDLQGFVARLNRNNPDQDSLSRFLFDNLSKETQQLITGSADVATLRKALAKDLNVLLERELTAYRELRRKQREIAEIEERIFEGAVSHRLQKRKEQLAAEIQALSKIGPLYDSDRFAHVKLSEDLAKFLKQQLEIEQEQRARPDIEFPYNSARIRLNRRLLEEAYPDCIAKSSGGVYPDREIYIATPEDSAMCFSNYLVDAQIRLARNELKPGEDVREVDEGGMRKVQVAGQVAVMSINALIAGIIFTNTPDHEFYIEESFPLDWMYPFLTPYGIIMKINREPLAELNEEILQRDHHFWSHYSERLIGNWITYDTPLSNIVEFCEKVYLRKDFSGFKGCRKFARDDQAQKAFSKLRSAIAGVYTWRIFNAARSIQEQQRLIREAEFAFKQAFAFCPYSPEAVFRYAQLLVALQRIDDALLIAKTCLKLDPYNAAVISLVNNLTEARSRSSTVRSPQSAIEQLDAHVKNNPTDFQAAFDLAALYIQTQQTNRALEVLDRIRTNPAADLKVLNVLALGLAQIGQLDRLEPVLEKLAIQQPEYPEAWYELAALKAALLKQDETIRALEKALALNASRLAKDPKARNLTNELARDERFKHMRVLPEFRRLVEPP